MNKNPNCHHGHCKTPDGEVRRLPTTEGGESAVILCFECYKEEARSRREYNKECGERIWQIPKWDELDVEDVA